MSERVFLSEFLIEEFTKRYFYKILNIRKKSYNKTIIMDNVIKRTINNYSTTIDFPELKSLYFRSEFDQSFRRWERKNLYGFEPEFPYAYIFGGMFNSIPFSSLCSVLNIDLKKVKENLAFYDSLLNDQRIKFIGYGGAVCNLHQFIMCFKREVRNRTKTDPIIYENDSFSFHNMFRIYDHRLLLSGLDIYHLDINNIMPKVEYSLVKSSFSLRKFNENLLRETHSSYIPREHILYVGAPDIETRELFQKCEKNLLLFVHKNSNGYIAQNIPVSGLEQETYGRINVPILLLNILKMTEKFLEYCRKFATNELDPNENEKMIFEFNVENFLREKYYKLPENNKSDYTSVDFQFAGRTYSIFTK